MASNCEKAWNAAKAAFEKATGRKKPSGEFLAVFSRSGLTPATQAMDKVADGEAEAMEKALAAFRKTGADYQKKLVAADKKGEGNAYKAAIAALSKSIDDIGDDYEKLVQAKLPEVVKLPDSISRSDNIFRRCKNKEIEAKPVAFGVGFTEKSVRISKMISDEMDGLIQTLIMRCSNYMRDLEEEIAELVDGAAEKLEKAATEKEGDKILAVTEKACDAIIDKYRTKVDSEVDKICTDWFTKHKIASAYKRGFALSWVKGVVGISIAVGATIATSGAALVPLMIAIAKQAPTLGSLAVDTYKYARLLETTEKELFKLNTELVALYNEGSRLKIEFTELQAHFGAPWASGVADLEKTGQEYTKKCVDYETKSVAPLKKQYTEIDKLIKSVVKLDSAVGKKLTASYSEVFDAIAQENALLEKRMDLRIEVTESIETLKGRRKGALKAYAVYDGASGLNSCYGAIKDIITIAKAFT